MNTGLSSGVSVLGDIVSPEPMPVLQGQIWGPLWGAYLEPVPFLFLVQDRSPPGLVGLSFRTSMPLSAFSSPLSTTSQVGQRPWQHSDQGGGRGLKGVLDKMEMRLPSLCERKEDSSAQGGCE